MRERGRGRAIVDWFAGTYLSVYVVQLVSEFQLFPRSV